MAATAGQPNPWLPYAWLRLLDRELTELAASRAEYLRTGKESGTHFLCVLCPNRHGKSRMGSVYFPAWWLGTFPNDWVILTGHKAQLVEGFSEEIRNLIRDKGRRLFPAVPDLAVSTGSSAKDYWRLAPPYQGGLIATGVGSPPTGAGGHLICIDDPIRSDAEAYSATYRDNLWRWWQYSIRNRLEPGGVIVLIMSRWTPDDIVGHLLQLQGEAGPAADYEFNDRWRVLRLPALAEAQLPGEPPDPLGRKEGEALMPSRYSREKLLALRDGPSGMGPLAFEALFQNNPQPVEGEKFLVSKWAFIDRGEVPRDVRLLRCWDLAATEKKQGNDPDWTVGVLMGRDREGYIYVLDVIRVREDDPSGLIRTTAELDWQWFGRKVRVRMPQDPGQAGKAMAGFYRKLLAGFELTTEPETGDKVARAMPFASYQRGGNVRLLRDAPWVAEFVSELKQFPHGGHDDQCFPAGTLVMRSDGPCPIERVHVGDNVLGRSGWVGVEAAGRTGSASVASRFGLTATSAHPVATRRGWVPFLEVTDDDRLWVCDALRTAATARQRPQGDACAVTSAYGEYAKGSLLGRCNYHDPISVQWRAAPLGAGLSGVSVGRITGAYNFMGTLVTPLFDGRPPAGPFVSRRSNSTGSPSADTPTHLASPTGATTSPEDSGSSLAFKPSIKRFGRLLTAPFHRGGTFTTATATGPITPWTTWNVYPHRTMDNDTARVDQSTVAHPSSLPISSASAHSLRLGTDQRRARRGTANMPPTWVGDGLSVPVYNLTTSDGTYFADGVLVHNCDAAANAFSDLCGLDRADARVLL